jgi:hypothetical protein
VSIALAARSTCALDTNITIEGALNGFLFMEV